MAVTTHPLLRQFCLKLMPRLHARLRQEALEWSQEQGRKVTVNEVIHSICADYFSDAALGEVMAARRKSGPKTSG